VGTLGFEVPKRSRRSLSAGNSSRELQSNFVSRGIIIITILGEQFSFAKFSKWMKIRVQRQRLRKNRMGDRWGRNLIKRKDKNKTGYYLSTSKVLFPTCQNKWTSKEVVPSMTCIWY
jgi:hypothetical protein